MVDDQHKNEMRIEISAEYLESLRAEIARTGLGSHRFCQAAPKLPDGLSARTIDNWLACKSKSALSTYLDFVLAQYRSLPAELHITSEMYERLHAELGRTGLSCAGDFVQLPDKPETLSAETLQGFISGRLKAISETHWSFICDALAAQTDAPLAKDNQTLFHKELIRTGTTFSALSKIILQREKRCYSAKQLKAIAKDVGGETSQQVWKDILITLSALPDKRLQTFGTSIVRDQLKQPSPSVLRQRIPITDTMRDELNEEFERSGITTQSLRTYLARTEFSPTVLVISRWRSGKIKSAYKHQWEMVLNVLLNLPASNT